MAQAPSATNGPLRRMARPSPQLRSARKLRSVSQKGRSRSPVRKASRLRANTGPWRTA
ncbi:hypothetical protein NY78_3134 [Desulfovibrio sp. TomC]|nr:hypothetical protein NY78_3134 [Desulfovibrio sp. TomC]